MFKNKRLKMTINCCLLSFILVASMICAQFTQLTVRAESTLNDYDAVTQDVETPNLDYVSDEKFLEDENIVAEENLTSNFVDCIEVGDLNNVVIDDDLYTGDICVLEEETFYPLFEKKQYANNELITINIESILFDDPVSMAYTLDGFALVCEPTYISSNLIEVQMYSQGQEINHKFSITAYFEDNSSITANVYGVLTDRGLFLNGSSYDASWDIYYHLLYDEDLITEDEYIYCLDQVNNIPLLENTLATSNITLFGTAETQSSATLISKVTGTLGWYDDSNIWHPLQFVKLVISDIINLTYSSAIYTNENGYFEYSYSTVSSRLLNVIVYPGGENVMVYTGTGGAYAHTITDFVVSGTIANFTWNATMNSDMGQAFQISQAAITADRYATAMNGSSLSSVKIKYPHQESLTNSFYRRSEKTIFMFQENGKNGNPNSYASWDVIMHEYGHHVQYELGIINSPGLSHTFTDNLIKYIDIKNPNKYTNSQLKDYAIRLAWGESYPSVFSGMAQAYYSSILQNIATVGDAAYSSSNGANINYETTFSKTTSTKCTSEACEGAIIGLLWDMYDSVAETHDKISLGHTGMWNLMKNCGSTTMSQFATYYINNYTVANVFKFGQLLSYYGMAASNLSVDSSGTYPSFSWTANGTYPSTLVTTNGTSLTYPNNLFDLVFYTSSYSEILRIENITTTNYTLNSSQWDSVLYSIGTNYYVVVVASQTDSPATGNYYSEALNVTKPTYNNSKSVSFSPATRYLETQITLSPGSYFDYYITFETEGTKIFQTFGTQDTVLYLYNSSDTLLTSNDDGGYKLNGLICYYLSANIQYKVHVKLFSNSHFGTLKLSVTPACGALKSGVSSLSNYNDIYNITDSSYTWRSFADINYTRMVTFTPPSDGTYTFELESTFDNYIYVIDPRSTAILINNIDYNDDGGTGNNAKFSKCLQEDVTYLIIYCKYNPGAAFSETDSTDLKLVISDSGIPTVLRAPTYLTLELTERSGFIVYNWKVKITNPNAYAVQVTYNSKMCHESDAKNYTNLTDLETIIIPANSSTTVTINGNGTAGWITTCIDYSYGGSSYRRVTCANGLSGDLTMNTPVNNQIPYN
jgi:hypothetical protein